MFRIPEAVLEVARCGVRTAAHFPKEWAEDSARGEASVREAANVMCGFEARMNLPAYCSRRAHHLTCDENEREGQPRVGRLRLGIGWAADLSCQARSSDAPTPAIAWWLRQAVGVAEAVALTSPVGIRHVDEALHFCIASVVLTVPKADIASQSEVAKANRVVALPLKQARLH